MKSNKEIIAAFVNGQSASNVNLTSTGDRLINYSTVIAERMDDGTVVFNGTRYTVSTSKIQSYARAEIVDYVEVKQVPINTLRLGKYYKG